MPPPTSANAPTGLGSPGRLNTSWLSTTSVTRTTASQIDVRQLLSMRGAAAHTTELAAVDIAGGAATHTIVCMNSSASGNHRLPEPDRPWVMRTYSGHSNAKKSNELYRMNLAK